MDLKTFLDHFNDIHPNIQFTMETESNAHILSWMLTYIEDIAPSGTVCTRNLPTPTCI